MIKCSDLTALRLQQSLWRRLKEQAMALIYDLVKDRRIYSIDAEASVLEAARFMMEHNIGALPVLRNG